MDLLGIVIVTVGTFSSGIYYLFFCEAGLQRLHWAIVSLPERHCYRCSNFASRAQNAPLAESEVGAFVAFGASSFIPLLHGVQRYGLEYMLQYSGMKWYLLELTFHGTGVSLYAFRIRSVLYLVNLIFGEARTRSFISLSYAQCIHTWLPCCKVSQPVIHWKSVSLKVPIERI
ncbi:hypothetical protein PG989_000483 [Apiospora arundinis]